ncbi:MULTISPECIES: hypothetical protein [Bradyrhizobium]|uniref:hypothetical protein n=1 Tax=Bradyrhizobium TaxID=374 RepID=UPI0012F4C790|nr:MULTISPECIES: hypothetical protein [Bradyrhizobium]MBR1294545.1 hypothetical protein [Bradyrhizobium ottawaense]WLB43938.1 hypothetical protein QIH93_25785 [Bradyrhizobium ottawaense]
MHSADRRERPVAPAVDRVPELALEDFERDFRRLLSLDLSDKFVDGIAKLCNIPLVRNAERCAGLVGRGSAMCVGRLQNDLVAAEAALLELADHEILKLRADL